MRKRYIPRRSSNAAQAIKQRLAALPQHFLLNRHRLIQGLKVLFPSLRDNDFGRGC